MFQILSATAASTRPLVICSSLLPFKTKLPIKPSFCPHNSKNAPPSLTLNLNRMSWLAKLGLGFGGRTSATTDSASASSVAQGPDDDIPAPGQQFAQFGAGCFWGVELAFQRVSGVTKTEVGYSQGFLHNPSYNDVCSGTTNHSEVVRVQFDPKECSYEDLLDLFWASHDPTMLNRQVNLLQFWGILRGFGASCNFVEIFLL